MFRIFDNPGAGFGLHDRAAFQPQGNAAAIVSARDAKTRYELAGPCTPVYRAVELYSRIPHARPGILDSGIWLPRRQRDGLTARALRLERQGSRSEADFLFRLAFARGEANPALEDAIQRITETAMTRVKDISISTYSPEDKEHLSSKPTDARSVRNFFEKTAGLKMTLADVVDALDCASPAVRLHGVGLGHCLFEDGTPLLTFDGEYRIGDLSPEIRCKADIKIENNRPAFTRILIELPDELKGFSFGTRGMLKIAILAKMLGIGSWKDMITDDGRYAWPKMGATLTADSIEHLVKGLRKLEPAGLKLGDDIRTIFDIAAITMDPEDASAVEMIRNWLRQEFHMSVSATDEILSKPPYKVGMAALEYVLIYADFIPDHIIARLMGHTMPERLADGLRGPGEGVHVSADFMAAAEDGLAQDFKDALTKKYVLDSLEAGAQEGSILLAVSPPALLMPESGLIQSGLACLRC